MVFISLTQKFIQQVMKITSDISHYSLVLFLLYLLSNTFFFFFQKHHCIILFYLSISTLYFIFIFIFYFVQLFFHRYYQINFFSPIYTLSLTNLLFQIKFDNFIKRRQLNSRKKYKMNLHDKSIESFYQIIFNYFFLYLIIFLCQNQLDIYIYICSATLNQYLF